MEASGPDTQKWLREIHLTDGNDCRQCKLNKQPVCPRVSASNKSSVRGKSEQLEFAPTEVRTSLASDWNLLKSLSFPGLSLLSCINHSPEKSFIPTCSDYQLVHKKLCQTTGLKYYLSLILFMNLHSGQSSAEKHLPLSWCICVVSRLMPTVRW